jgi:hypothetical protein
MTNNSLLERIRKQQRDEAERAAQQIYDVMRTKLKPEMEKRKEQEKAAAEEKRRQQFTKMTTRAERLEPRITRQFFGDMDEFLVKDDYICYPILFDTDIVKELRSSKDVLEFDGKNYIRGIKIQTIAENYEKFDPQTYHDMKIDFLRKALPERTEDFKDYCQGNDLLRMIVFEIMPYFIAKNRKLEEIKEENQANRKGVEEKILSLVKERTTIPDRYYQEARGFCKLDDIEYALKRLEEINNPEIPSGLFNAKMLETILIDEIEGVIVKKSRKELEGNIELKKELVSKKAEHIAALLYLKEAERFELENFGFIREHDATYTIYKKLEPYALREFNGDVYLFPECIVGFNVPSSTNVGVPIPLVLNEYKHPFLPGHSEHQKICIRDFRNTEEKPNERIITALNMGVDTILYGYFNQIGFFGFHSLDGRVHNTQYHHSTFGEYRISEDDPRIKNGTVVITNDPFIQIKKS